MTHPNPLLYRLAVAMPLLFAGMSCDFTSLSAAEPPTPHNAERLVIINDDGFSKFYSGQYTTAEDLQNTVMRLKDTQVAVFEWCFMAGSRVNFPSKEFEMIGEGLTEFPRRGDKRAADSYQRLKKEGVDTLEVVANACREAGVQCYASMRMNGDYPTNWHGELNSRYFNSSFWWDHPELRVKGKEGEDKTKFSYAYPEVREMRLRLLREVVERDVDGINLDFLRHPLFFGYDPPLLAAFEKKYGEDPRKLPDADPRWRQLYSDVMTGFVREVRTLLDEAGQTKGRRIGLSARVDWRYGKIWGCDTDAWLKEGLLDYLVVGQRSLGGYEFDISPFVEKAKASACAVLFGEEATVEGHDTTPEEDKAAAEGKAVLPKRKTLTIDEYKERAARWYAAGADGVHLFNETRREPLQILGSIPPHTSATESDAAKDAKATKAEDLKKAP